jgi:predicted P-loop ATPase/GTPase
MSSTQNGGAALVPSSAAPASSSDNQNNQQISRVPTYACFQHATKVAILEDKPIILDYWTSSLDKSCLIGVRSNNEKLLVKSEDEYTSPIAKIFKVDTEYIIVTANSVYIVSADISTRRIN